MLGAASSSHKASQILGVTEQHFQTLDAKLLETRIEAVRNLRTKIELQNQPPKVYFIYLFE